MAEIESSELGMRKTKLKISILPSAFFLLPCAFLSVSAQPYIVSKIPDYAASGVSPTAPVVFTFSEAMNPGATTVQFYRVPPLTFYATSNYWSVGNTVLTCTPAPAFMANSTIFWNVSGANPVGDSMSDSGFFNTGSAAPATPVLTNAASAITNFTFDVFAPFGQTITIEYSSLLISTSWTSALTTNAPAAGRFSFSDPRSVTNRFLFYRARTGS